MQENSAKTGRGAGRLSADETAKLADRLLDAAQDLFAEKGFKDTTMGEVARRAGSSTQTIYSRYASKVELLQAVVRRLGEHTYAALQQASTAEPHGVEPREFLVTMGCAIAADLTRGIAGVNRLAFAEAHRMPELRLVSAHGFDRGAARIRRALEQWRADGTLTVAGDPHLASAICMSMLTDRPRIRAVLGEPMSQDEAKAYITQAVDIFLYGCAGPPAPAKP